GNILAEMHQLAYREGVSAFRFVVDLFLRARGGGPPPHSAPRARPRRAPPVRPDVFTDTERSVSRPDTERARDRRPETERRDEEERAERPERADPGEPESPDALPDPAVPAPDPAAPVVPGEPGPLPAETTGASPHVSQYSSPPPTSS
ncbi:hypothetical protein ACFV0R_24530, partial [Streptomyces sp. NPDC059578]